MKILVGVVKEGKINNYAPMLVGGTWRVNEGVEGQHFRRGDAEGDVGKGGIENWTVNDIAQGGVI